MADKRSKRPSDTTRANFSGNSSKDQQRVIASKPRDNRVHELVKDSSNLNIKPTKTCVSSLSGHETKTKLTKEKAGQAFSPVACDKPRKSTIGKGDLNHKDISHDCFDSEDLIEKMADKRSKRPSSGPHANFSGKSSKDQQRVVASKPRDNRVHELVKDSSNLNIKPTKTCVSSLSGHETKTKLTKEKAGQAFSPVACDKPRKSTIGKGDLNHKDISHDCFDTEDLIEKMSDKRSKRPSGAPRANFSGNISKDQQRVIASKPRDNRVHELVKDSSNLNIKPSKTCVSSLSGHETKTKLTKEKAGQAFSPVACDKPRKSTIGKGDLNHKDISHDCFDTEDLIEKMSDKRSKRPSDTTRANFSGNSSKDQQRVVASNPRDNRVHELVKDFSNLNIKPTKTCVSSLNDLETKAKVIKEKPGQAFSPVACEKPRKSIIEKGDLNHKGNNIVSDVSIDEASGGISSGMEDDEIFEEMYDDTSDIENELYQGEPLTLSLNCPPIKCPIAQCNRTINVTSVLAHYLADHCDTFDMELIEIWTNRRAMLSYNPLLIEFHEPTCLGILVYGAYDPKKCPGNRGLCMPNTGLTQSNKYLENHLVILLMGCRTSSTIFGSNPEIGEKLGTHPSDCQEFLLIWLSTVPTATTINCKLTLINEYLNYERSCVMGVRSLNDSQSPSEFVHNDINFMHLSHAEESHITKGFTQPLEIEIMIKEM